MTTVFGSRNAEIQLLLGVVGAPLIPLPIRCDHQPINRNIKDHPIVSAVRSPICSLIKSFPFLCLSYINYVVTEFYLLGFNYFWVAL